MVSATAKGVGPGRRSPRQPDRIVEGERYLQWWVAPRAPSMARERQLNWYIKVRRGVLADFGETNCGNANMWSVVSATSRSWWLASGRVFRRSLRHVPPDTLQQPGHFGLICLATAPQVVSSFALPVKTLTEALAPAFNASSGVAVCAVAVHGIKR